MCTVLPQPNFRKEILLANFWFWVEQGKIWKISSWAVPKDLDPRPDPPGEDVSFVR